MKFIIIITLLLSSLFAKLSIQDIQTIKYRVKLLESRASGDIYAQNKRGYLGRYQFGAVALVAVGLIKKKSYFKATYFNKKLGVRKWKKGYSNKSFLSNTKNWNLSNGKYSFLGNEILQENAMDELIRQNYNYLKRANLNLSKQEEIAFLMAAHLGGFSSALKYVKNKIDFRDAFGTSISKYYKAGLAKLSKYEQNKIAKLTKHYLGSRYIWGGTTKRGFDCSGYTQFIYRKFGINLPRTALEQSKIGKKVSIRDLKKGDLVFFLTDKKRKIPITHVGIYLKNGKFIHAASKRKGVVISTLREYKSRFVMAKRVLNLKHSTKYSGVNKLKKSNFSSTKVAMRTRFKYKIINGKYVLIN